MLETDMALVRRGREKMAGVERMNVNLCAFAAKEALIVINHLNEHGKISFLVSIAVVISIQACCPRRQVNQHTVTQAWNICDQKLAMHNSPQLDLGV